tara:strand:+ start:426 stop:755 length:330 start_codon:yes stop_codon:yes gene_type:complete
MKIVELDSSLNVYVGQTAAENWLLIDKYKNDNYLWFHLSSFPSCHVFVENIDISNTDIIKIANICKENTKYRAAKNIKVDYTAMNNIKKGGDVGSVIFKSSRKVNTIKI